MGGASSTEESPAIPLNVPEPILDQLDSSKQKLSPSGEFTLELHSAVLYRSFNKDIINAECHFLSPRKFGSCMLEVGWMNPYAIVIVNGEEALRTEPAQRAHKNPVWGAKYTCRGRVPENITIAVWDKSDKYHSDAFCGAVTIPCSPDMNPRPNWDVNIKKRSNLTGSVSVSLEVNGEMGKTGSTPRRHSSSGHEMDLIISHASSRDGLEPGSLLLNRPLSLQGGEVTFDGDHKGDADHGDSDDEAAEASLRMLTANPVYSFPASDVAPASDIAEEMSMLSAAGRSLAGSWKCISTEGLDPFLAATGIGVFQRRIACACAWPKWVFEVKDDHVLFLNHSALGLLREEIPLGRDFTSVDGKQNPLASHATWTPAPEGGCLLIKRDGAPGRYREERTVSGNTMSFVLTNETVGCFWGRSFTRE